MEINTTTGLRGYSEALSDYVNQRYRSGVSGEGTVKVISSAATSGVNTMEEGVRAVSAQRLSVSTSIYTPEGKKQAVEAVRLGQLIGAA